MIWICAVFFVVVSSTLNISPKSPYGAPIGAFIWISWYLYSLIHLKIRLKSLNQDDFKQEIRSINFQNYTFLVCAIIAGTDVVMLDILYSDETVWDFRVTIAAMCMMAAFRIIFDLHFLLVHNGVFKETSILLESNEIEQEEEDHGIVVVHASEFAISSSVSASQDHSTNLVDDADE